MYLHMYLILITMFCYLSLLHIIDFYWFFVFINIIRKLFLKYLEKSVESDEFAESRDQVIEGMEVVYMPFNIQY